MHIIYENETITIFLITCHHIHDPRGIFPVVHINAWYWAKISNQTAIFILFFYIHIGTKNTFSCLPCWPHTHSGHNILLFICCQRMSSWSSTFNLSFIEKKKKKMPSSLSSSAFVIRYTCLIFTVCNVSLWQLCVRFYFYGSFELISELTCTICTLYAIGAVNGETNCFHTIFPIH